MSSIAVLIADPNSFYLNPWNICPRFQVLVLIDYSFRFFKNFILTSWIKELSSDWSGNYRHHRQRWALGFPFFWSTKILKRFKAVLLHSWSFLGRQKLQIFFSPQLLLLDLSINVSVFCIPVCCTSSRSSLFHFYSCRYGVVVEHAYLDSSCHLWML